MQSYKEKNSSLTLCTQALRISNQKCLYSQRITAHMTNKSFVHFPTLLTMQEAPKHADIYSKSPNNLHHEFRRTFLNFEKIQKPIQLLSATLSQVAATAP